MTVDKESNENARDEEVTEKVSTDAGIPGGDAPDKETTDDGIPGGDAPDEEVTSAGIPGEAVPDGTAPNVAAADDHSTRDETGEESATDGVVNSLERTGRLLCFLCLLAVFIGMIVLLRGGVSVVAEAASVEKDPFGSFSLMGNEDCVAVVRVYGVIAFSNETSGFPAFSSGADHIVRTLHRLRSSDRVKAVVLRINSPGGTVAASQEICNQVKALVAEGKKVVVSMGDVAASGGYYISAPASYIMANPGTLTGSIGVITSMMDYRGLLKWVGVNYRIIKSGKYKDMGAGYRDMSEDERALFERIIKGAWGQFVDEVAAGRIIKEERDGRKPVITSKEKLKNELAQGQIFLGTDALKAGLVDELGDYLDAVKKAGELAGLGKDPKVIFADTPPGIQRLMELFGSRASNSLDSLKAVVHGSSLPPVLYMYVPGKN